MRPFIFATIGLMLLWEREVDPILRRLLAKARHWFETETMLLKGEEGTAFNRDRFALGNERLFWVAAALIVILAVSLRFYRIDSQELWLDEALAAHMAVTPHWLEGAKFDTHPLLYFSLLRGWTRLFGESELALRSLSAAFAVLFIAAVIWTGREIFGSRAGLWSGAFAAVAPMHIYYSQEARNYTLLILLLCLTYLFIWKAMKENDRLSWGLALACGALSLHVHYFALVALLPTAILLPLWPEKDKIKERWVRYGIAVGLSGVLFIPWLVWSQSSPYRIAGQVNWIKSHWHDTPPALAIPKSLEVLTLGTHAGFLPTFFKQMSILEFPFSLRVIALATLALLALAVIVPWGDSRLGVPWPGRRKIWAASLMVVPLALLWIGSFVKPVYVVGRYDMIAFPAFALLLGVGLAKVQGIKTVGIYLAPLLSVGLLFPMAAKLFRYYESPTTRPLKATAEVLHEHAKDSDVVVVTGHGVEVLYYIRRLGYEDGYCSNLAAERHFTCKLFPLSWEARFFRPGKPEANSHLSAGYSIQDQAKSYVSALGDRGGRLWMILARRTLQYRPDGKLRVFFTAEEAALAAEFQSMGFHRSHIQKAPWVAVFRRRGDLEPAGQ